MSPTTAAPTPTAPLVPPTPQPSPITTALPSKTTHRFYSRQVRDYYKIYVSLPQGYDPQSSEGYHTIYLLDGDWYFDGSHWRLGAGGVVGIVSRLRQRGSIPPCILVGIGYIGANQRGRDFLRGYTHFYWFLRDELIPFIDTEYNTDPRPVGRTLIGHSDGGYFTLYALFRYGRPDHPFHNFVAISGDFTKNERLPFSEEYKLYLKIKDSGILDATLYMAVGGQEESRFVESNQEMEEQLNSRNYRGFQFKSVEYSSFNHGTIVSPAIKDGLIWVFSKE